jgi:predicted PurR-regulated permease PerM
MAEPPPPEDIPRGQTGLTVAVGVAMSVAAFYLARDVLVPLVLAALLSFALSPPMLWLRRHRVPRVPSVVVVVTIAFVAIFGIGRLVVGQVSQLADNLPTYEHNLQQKVHSLQGATKVGGGVLGHAAEMLRNLGQEIDGSGVDDGSSQAQLTTHSIKGGKGGLETAQVKPVPVQIQQAAPAPLELLQTVVGPLLGPLATTGLIIVFVISFLFQRENLRDRFIRLVGSRDLHRTTEALNEAGSRVSRYLLLQGMVNIVYSVPIFLGLTLIGIPNAVLWAMLVVLLRFVPYLGIIIAGLFPLVLSLAVDPGWNMLIYTATLFVSIEMVFGNVIEPWLYGMNTGLSPVAIIVAATFWTWLWGPIGLLLSTPLTVCLVVLGRHAPPLRFLHVLLGNDAPLAPSETFYQRLLADDPAEAAEHCEALLKDKSLLAIYDEVVLPALALAQDDNDRGVLSRKMRTSIRRGIAEVIETFTAHEDGNTLVESDAQLHDSLPPVLCIAGRNDLDEAAAGLMLQLLAQRNVRARLVSSDAVFAGEEHEATDVRATANTRAVFISSMSASPVKARLLVRKLKRRYLTDTRIIIGFWGAPLGSDDARRERLATTGGDLVVTTLHEAVEEILAALSRSREGNDLADLTLAAANALQKIY